MARGRREGWIRALSVGLALALTLGCGRSSAPELSRAPATTGTAQQTQAAPDTTRAPEAAPARPEALRYLPANTPLVLHAASPQALAAALDAPAYAAFHDRFITPRTSSVINAFARHLSEPEALGRLGVALTAPAGFAWVDPQSMTSALFWRVADAAALDKALGELVAAEGLRVEHRTVGAAQVTYYVTSDPWIGTHAWLVRRDEHALLLLSPHPREVGDRVARDLALLPPDRSLAEAPDRAAPLSAAGPGAVVALQGQAALSPVIGGWASALATRFGADAATVERAWTLYRRAREDASMALRVTLRPSQVVLEGVSDSSETLAHDLLAPPRYLERFLPAQAAGVGAFAHAAFEVPQLREVVGTLAFAGQDPLASLQSMVGGRVDLEAELLPTLSGEVAVAVGLGQTPPLSTLGLWQALDGALLLGVRDAPALEALIERLRTDMMVAFVVGRDAPGRYTIRLPGVPVVHVALLDDALVAATEPALIERVMSGTPGGFVATLEAQGLAPLLDDPGTALIAGFNPTFVTTPLLIERLGPPPPPLPPLSPPLSPPVEAAQRAWLAARDARRAALDEVGARLGALYTAHEQTAGFYVAHVAPGEAALRMSMGWRGVTGSFDALVRGSVAIQDDFTAAFRAADEAYDLAWRLAGPLMDDLTRAMNAGTAPP